MSLKQQIKTLTRDIRQRKDQRRQALRQETREIQQRKDQRQRLRQALRQQTRDKSIQHIGTLRENLKTQNPPATVKDWAELVQTYVQHVLGHGSFISVSAGLGLEIVWCQGGETQQWHLVQVVSGGAAIHTNMNRSGCEVGEKREFHLANDLIRFWPL